MQIFQMIRFFCCNTYEVRKSQQCRGSGCGFLFSPRGTASPEEQLSQLAFDGIQGYFWTRFHQSVNDVEHVGLVNDVDLPEPM